VELRVPATTSKRRFDLLGRRRERAAADAWLIERTHTVTGDPRITRRIAELTSARHRLTLARSLRGVVHDARRPGISASPLNRRAVLAAAAALNDVASLLEDARHPVTPRGVLLTTRLLTDGGSPLYGRRAAGDLADAAGEICAALERP
jgi:hypothetical protein